MLKTVVDFDGTLHCCFVEIHSFVDGTQRQGMNLLLMGWYNVDRFERK